MGRNRIVQAVIVLVLLGQHLGQARASHGHRQATAVAEVPLFDSLAALPLYLQRPSEASAHQAAALQNCQARWGRELGGMLCPAMFAASDAASGKRNVELGILRALWHLSQRQAVWAWQRGCEQVAVAAALLGPLLREDPL